MVRESVLMRTADKISAYIQKYVDTLGAEKKEEVLELMENMQQLFPQWAIMPCPIMHPELPFITDNCEEIFGYTREYILGSGHLTKLFSHVHEADQQDLHDCMNYIHDLLEALPPAEHSNYRYALHYRFKKANGQYIYLHDEKAVLNLYPAGNLYYGLFRDVTEERIFSGVKAEVFCREPVFTKLKEYKPSSARNPLSKREKELVTLMKQGLSTKEIAWYLNISHNTVRNIKSRLFEKYNVNNSIELLNMAG